MHISLVSVYLPVMNIYGSDKNLKREPFIYIIGHLTHCLLLLRSAKPAQGNMSRCKCIDRNGTYMQCKNPVYTILSTRLQRHNSICCTLPRSDCAYTIHNQTRLST